jgi:hypothetical protein
MGNGRGEDRMYEITGWGLIVGRMDIGGEEFEACEWERRRGRCRRWTWVGMRWSRPPRRLIEVEIGGGFGRGKLG